MYSQHVKNMNDYFKWDFKKLFYVQSIVHIIYIIVLQLCDKSIVEVCYFLVLIVN